MRVRGWPGCERRVPYLAFCIFGTTATGRGRLFSARGIEAGGPKPTFMGFGSREPGPDILQNGRTRWKISGERARYFELKPILAVSFFM